MQEEFSIRFATEQDVPLILELIKGIAAYEKMLDQVVATEEILHEWLFEKQKAEVLLGEVNGESVGFALFFHNFSTFLGRGGLYLEDIFIRPAFRGRGYGKAFFHRLASIAVERGCGRMEWVCLNWNKPSIAFYRSMGAVPMDEWTIYRLTSDQLADIAQDSCMKE